MSKRDIKKMVITAYTWIFVKLQMKKERAVCL